MTATATATHDIIEDLRGRIRAIEGRAPSSSGCVATGWRMIDALLPGGGFPRGALSALVGGAASGKTAIALAAVAHGTQERGVAAFVDGRHELYPPAAAALGVDLERLLVVRPHRDGAPADGVRVGLWSAEALLASGAFEVVVIDVALETAAAAIGAAPLDRMFRRLRAAAEQGGAAGLWIAGPGSIRCPAAVRLDCARVAAGWEVRRAHARGLVDAGAGPLAMAVAPVDHAA